MVVGVVHWLPYPVLHRCADLEAGKYLRCIPIRTSEYIDGGSFATSLT